MRRVRVVDAAAEAAIVSVALIYYDDNRPRTVLSVSNIICRTRQIEFRYIYHCEALSASSNTRRKRIRSIDERTAHCAARSLYK